MKISYSILLVCSFVECFDTSNRLALFKKHHAQLQQNGALQPEKISKPSAITNGHTKNARRLRRNKPENKQKSFREENCTPRTCTQCLAAGNHRMTTTMQLRCAAIGRMENCCGNRINSAVMQTTFWNKYSLSYQGHSILSSLLN